MDHYLCDGVGSLKRVNPVNLPKEKIRDFWEWWYAEVVDFIQKLNKRPEKIAARCDSVLINEATSKTCRTDYFHRRQAVMYVGHHLVLVKTNARLPYSRVVEVARSVVAEGTPLDLSDVYVLPTEAVDGRTGAPVAIKRGALTAFLDNLATDGWRPEAFGIEHPVLLPLQSAMPMVAFSLP